ncbi:hypothetical protein [Klebsiella pneumoniae IS53]|nr:hypothetical protein [Klebsiella pneumoniae IS53]
MPNGVMKILTSRNPLSRIARHAGNIGRISHFFIYQSY